ncbi:MAG: lipoyl synthase [Verrucomicrobiota bacterium]
MTTAETSTRRFPPWIRKSLKTEPEFVQVNRLVSGFKLNTVCEDAKCPNRNECWNRGTATMMILGEVCTRSCRFCSVKSGIPPSVDTDEPRRVARAAAGMQLKHIVITSVDRDDLADGGAAIWADTIRAVAEELPGICVEVLTPDFGGDEASMETVLQADPQIFSHNLETVSRLQPVIRPQANYGRSLAVLRYAAERDPDRAVKSGLMVGMGETEDEMIQAMTDLHAVGCRILTVGQYLRPTRNHMEVVRFVEPAEFKRYETAALEIGFNAVASGPMVRSSYRAEELFAKYQDALTG